MAVTLQLPWAYAELPPNQPVPGGLATVILPVESEAAPEARFGGRLVFVDHVDSKWVALVGLPCNIIPGNFILSVSSPGEEHSSVEFGVLPPGSLTTLEKEGLEISQEITVTAQELPPGITPSGVTNAAMSQDLMVEARRFSAIQSEHKFDPPVESRELVGYGSLISDEISECHDYLSYLTPPGNRVYAPAAGEVSAVPGMDNVNGTVVIAHGSQTFSILGNLEQILVEPGQWVDKGEVVGAAGGADIPTGGRVDWALVQNGYRVDPLRFAVPR